MSVQKNDCGYVGIRDIARMAGVSTATVSRVINNPEKTSPQVKARVEQLIRDTHYIPNQTAKNIFSKTSNSIALFIYDMENPFFTELIREINSICLAHKYTLLICATEDNPEREEEYMKYCVSNRCAGIILTEGCNYELFQPYKKQLPIVFLDRRSKGLYPSVHSNNYEMISQVIDYLYNLNHRKIAFIGCNKDLDSLHARQGGYLDGLKKHNLKVMEDYIYNKSQKLDLSTGKDALRHFLSLSKPPTAIVCCADIVALGVINEASMQNLKIPSDLSVVGFDDVIGNFHYPPITTVQQDLHTIADRLFHYVTNPPEKPVSEVVEATLVQGYTCQRVSPENS